jgi:hypothetical protein
VSNEAVGFHCVWISTETIRAYEGGASDRMLNTVPCATRLAARNASLGLPRGTHEQRLARRSIAESGRIAAGSLIIVSEMLTIRSACSMLV